MSTGETLLNIFFEPSETFQALRVRPRFLVAGIITVAFYMLFSTLYIQKIGYETVVRSQASVQAARNSSVTPEQLERGVQFQLNPLFKVIRMVSPVIVFVVIFAAGAALYLLGAMLMGKGINFKQALTVWTYSSMPPVVITMIINLVLLFVKPPDDDMSITQGAGRGLVHANPSLFIDGTAHPVLATAVGSLDVLSFFGLFLAAVGLQKIGRMSSGSAWGIVIGLWIIGIILRVGIATATGNVMA